MAPLITGNTTTRSRSTRPATSRDRPRLRLPSVRRGRGPSAFIARTAATVSDDTSRLFSQSSGAARVEEKTTFGTAPRAATAWGSSSAMPDMRRYVVAPIRIVCSSCPPSHSRYSGPPIPQSPGQPSAAVHPSSETMTSIISSGMGRLQVQVQAQVVGTSVSNVASGRQATRKRM